MSKITNKEVDNKTVLEVKDLEVSFRTNEGIVKAVRGVSYSLKQGETLTIVGESGSGKSVSSRAVMGILAGNAIIDNGSIMYEGQDLLKLREDEFHKIRGSKIGMIFQDPTSSLNPILRVGKQISEGMLVNGKRKKDKFELIFQKEYQDYINAKYLLEEYKTNYNFKLNKKRGINRYKVEIKQIRNNQSISQLQKDELIQNNLVIIEKLENSVPKLTKEERKVNIAEVKLKLKELKGPLKSKVKEAKAIIKEEYLGYKNDYKQEVLAFEEELKASENYNAFKYFVAKNFLHVVRLVKQDFMYKNSYKKLSELKEEHLRKTRVTKLEATEETLKIMEEVGIPEPEKRLNMYPFQFSGGMKQRIVIAIALTANPRVLICDEPTTALDVTIQAQVLELLKKLKRERDLSLIFITHNLGVVANMADRVAVMYAGRIVEYGDVGEIFYNPKHPYTWALLSSMPDLNSNTRLITIPGTPPNMLYPPKGDAFAQRNKYALEIDFKEQPPLFKVSDTHFAATWLLHENAPKVELPEIISERTALMAEVIKKMKKDLEDANTNN